MGWTDLWYVLGSSGQYFLKDSIWKVRIRNETRVTYPESGFSNWKGDGAGEGGESTVFCFRG